MASENDIVELIDLIYTAVFDDVLWHAALAKLAETTGAMQAIIATFDQRTGTFASIQRRGLPHLVESYESYWAFHNPLWTRTTAQPAGQVFSLDTLMPRQEFAKAPIFNEWWVPAGYSLALLGANLHVEDRTSSLVCVINARGNDTLVPGITGPRNGL